MGLANRAVSVVLRSPLHGLLSGSTALVRYTGRRSGRHVTTPVQYARQGEDVVILVGRPDTKVWWRNFGHDRAGELLVRREWIPVVALAVVGADDPEAIAPLLAAYLERFPKAVRALEGDTADQRARRAVMVRCRTR